MHQPSVNKYQKSSTFRLRFGWWYPTNSNNIPRYQMITHEFMWFGLIWGISSPAADTFWKQGYLLKRHNCSMPFWKYGMHMEHTQVMILIDCIWNKLEIFENDSMDWSWIFVSLILMIDMKWQHPMLSEKP